MYPVLHLSTPTYGLVPHIYGGSVLSTVDLGLTFTHVDYDRLPAGSEESATDDSAHAWLELLG